MTRHVFALSAIPLALLFGGAGGCSSDSVAGDDTSTCQDGTRNGQETDTDCGGPTCGPCEQAGRCMDASDCKSGLCTNNVCMPGADGGDAGATGGSGGATDGSAGATGGSAGQACASKLLFASAFDGDSRVDRSTITKPVLRGTDSTTGYNWATDLPGNQEQHWFNYVMSSGSYSHWQDCVESEVIDITNGPGGATKALFLEFKKDDPTHSATTRSQFNLTAAASGDDVQRLKRMYWAMDMKMDLKRTETGWDDFMEWKVNGETSRISLYIYGLKSGDTPYWYIKCEEGTGGTGHPKLWVESNKTVPVPDKEWFRIEAYWRASMGEDGFWMIAVDHKVLFNIKGKNRIDDNYFYTQPFKVYGSPGKSWYTNFEIRDSPPCTSVLSMQ